MFSPSLDGYRGASGFAQVFLRLRLALEGVILSGWSRTMK